VELIAEHLAAMTAEARLDAFVALLLRLGPAVGAVGLDAAASLTAPLRGEVFKHCLWIFWSRFPQDSFALLVALARKSLRLDDASAVEEEELQDLGRTGIRCAVQANDLGVTIMSTMVFWVILREKVDTEQGQAEAAAGLEKLLQAPLVETVRPQTGDDVARMGLEVIVLPLLADALLTLTVKDPDSALALLECLRQSRLWEDAFTCNCSTAPLLKELEWFLALCGKHADWAAAQAAQDAQWKVSMPRPAAGICRSMDFARACGWDDVALTSTEQVCCKARTELLDLAHPRLACDMPLLAHPRGTPAVLPRHQWEDLCSTVTCRVMFILLSVFEGAGDFEGAMNLGVSLSSSPWVLQLLTPLQARTFLHRLALLPARLDEGQIAALSY